MDESIRTGESTEVTLAAFPELPPSSGSGGFRGGPPTVCVFQSKSLSTSEDILCLPSVNNDLIRGDCGNWDTFFISSLYPESPAY